MKSVVVCGSSRFVEDIRAFGQKLEELGVVTYMPNLYRASGGVWSNLKEFDQKCVALGLTHDHFYKIRMSDVVFVYNKDGYIGNSTTLEMGYAVALNKPIYALSEDQDELCRNVLVREVVTSPEELVKKLK